MATPGGNNGGRTAPSMRCAAEQASASRPPSHGGAGPAPTTRSVMPSRARPVPRWGVASQSPGSRRQHEHVVAFQIEMHITRRGAKSSEDGRCGAVQQTVDQCDVDVLKCAAGNQCRQIVWRAATKLRPLRLRADIGYGRGSPSIRAICSVTACAMARASTGGLRSAAAGWSTPRGARLAALRLALPLRLHQQR